jgi:ketosteroid isomerase-like protein
MKSNLEIIQSGYNNFLQGNIPALVELLSDDITWELPKSAEVPFSGVFKGKNGVLEFFQQIAATNDFHEFNVTDFISEGDKVIALGNLRATSKTTGKTSSNKWAHFWQLKDGKVIRHYEYADTAEIKNAFSN